MVGIEGAVISGTLNILANKLAPLVIKQYSSIVGVTKDLQDLQDRVEEINCWLEKSGYKTVDNGELFNWLRQLKIIVYDVDDIVDEFHLEAEKHEANGGNHIVSKWLITKPKSFLFRCKAARKIKAIKERFAKIVKQRSDFCAIVNSSPDGHPITHKSRTIRAIPTLPIVDEASVHGRDQEKQEIISKLVDNQQIIKIVSVIGLGGCGKTTLAKLVFNDHSIVKEHFEVRIWVHVSQEFDIKKLVEKLFEAVSSEKAERYSLQQMTETISDKLTGKKYLLVLDDVWTEDRIKWEEFMVHIKSGAPGSSMLLTARSRRVAEALDSTDTFNLLFLPEADSWAVFSQSFGMAIRGLDSEFQEVGREIVNKCGGVPLAIKALAGVLRNKRRVEEWKAMRENNLIDVEDKEHRVSACLMLSYFHLQAHLKQCFTMCSLFPKGHMIYKEQLIDLWIAHDMISLTVGVDYLEDIGDDHFNSLVEVSLLQDVDEEDGRVHCKMHDLVHDLARSILHEEISNNVLEDATSSTKGYRYFSLVDYPIECLSQKVFRNARAIYAGDGNYEIFHKASMNTKQLRSIIANSIWSEEVLTAICQIKNLKYLNITKLHCAALPESISDIWSLQAVHLTYSDLHQLPESIGKLHKLRTLDLSHSKWLYGLPDSIGECIMLSSINLWRCGRLTALPNSIGRNEKLRVLRLGYTKIQKLPTCITSLRNLERLDLHVCVGLVELPEGMGNLEKLQVLNLEGCRALRGMPVGIRQLSRLQKLGLFVVGDDEKFARIPELANVGRNDEFLIIRGIPCVMEPDDAHRASLKQKTNLQRLGLQWRTWSDKDDGNTELKKAVLDGLEPPPGIKELGIFQYSGWRFAQWMQNQIGGGVQGIGHFPFLRVIRLYRLPNLKHLDGLVELPCLEILKLEWMSSLESISGGPFPSLVKLVMRNLTSLGEVWLAAERTISDGEEGGSCSNCTPHLGQFRVGNRVTYLKIYDCPKLKVKPYLPLSLQHCKLDWCSELLLQSPRQYEGCFLHSSFSHLKKLQLESMVCIGSELRWELLQHMTALESLDICSCELIELPESLGSLTSLMSLSVRSCSSIRMLPECLGELHYLQNLHIELCSSLSSLPQSIGHLTSLQELRIEYCRALHELPECLGELCSLRELVLYGLSGLTCLPESICSLTALKKLAIESCWEIKSLPEGIKGLTALAELRMQWCYKIKSLPEGIKGLTSLKKMKIEYCPGIKSLPEGIKGLTALETLWIGHCPDLERRYNRENGEGRHLVSHIPNLSRYYC